MKLRALSGSLLTAAAVAGVLAAPAGAATVTIAPATGDGKQTNCYPFGDGSWGPHAGYVYKNVPAFTLAPGDKIGFDTWRANDTDIAFDVSLAATTVNGGDVPAQAFTQVVGNTQLPRVPRGNAVVGDYDIEFAATGSFSFPGGGLVIRLSNPAAALAGDAPCDAVDDGNLVGAQESADASGFFVKRFYNDADGLFPWTSADAIRLAAFRIVNVPPGTGTGAGGGVTPSLVDTVKPTLGSLAFSRTSFAAAKSGASISAKKKRKPKIGTKISFNLSEPGSVKFTVERKAKGRKVGRKCAKPKRSNRNKRKCTRWTKVKGSFTVAGTAGKNSFTFRGRVGGKSLKPGKYRLNSRASDNAKNTSPLKRKAFKIVR